MSVKEEEGEEGRGGGERGEGEGEGLTGISSPVSLSTIIYARGESSRK